MNDDLPRAGAAPLPVLPCPFCGEKLVQLGDYNHEGGWNWWQHPLDDDLNTAGNCIAKGIKLDVNWYGPSKGIIAWNHRAAADVAGEKAGLIQAARSDARPSSSPSPAVRDAPITMATDWTFKERVAIEEMMASQELSERAVIRQALAHYQIVCRRAHGTYEELPS